MTATISIRPVIITGSTFTDGTSVFETANLAPISAWGIFIETGDGAMSGLAPDRDTALEAAQAMARQHGWRVIHVAPEGAEVSTNTQTTLQ